MAHTLGIFRYGCLLGRGRLVSRFLEDDTIHFEITLSEIFTKDIKIENVFNKGNRNKLYRCVFVQYTEFIMSHLDGSIS